MDVLTRFIGQLRAFDADYWPVDVASRLADHLEWRRAAPRNDGFDLVMTGDAERDREILAGWLQQCADAPTFLAPSWGRTFSEGLAWLLRNNHDVDWKSALLAQLAKDDENLAVVMREQGVPAAFALISGDRHTRTR